MVANLRLPEKAAVLGMEGQQVSVVRFEENLASKYSDTAIDAGTGISDRSGSMGRLKRHTSPVRHQCENELRLVTYIKPWQRLASHQPVRTRTEHQRAASLWTLPA
jgi:hypothetical protein